MEFIKTRQNLKILEAYSGSVEIKGQLKIHEYVYIYSLNLNSERDGKQKRTLSYQNDLLFYTWTLMIHIIFQKNGLFVLIDNIAHIWTFKANFQIFCTEQM